MMSNELVQLLALLILAIALGAIIEYKKNMFVVALGLTLIIGACSVLGI